MPSAMHGARHEQSAYRLERNLVSDFARCLRKGDTPWGRVRITFEFDYVGGYTDVLALCAQGDVMAFEAKLARWRDALHQAYRTRCFAHRSYVVLPAKTARLAVQHEHEFRRRRVGLCAMSAERGVEVLLETDGAEPFQPWISMRALAELSQRKPIWGR
jgi:hypothetical protein